MNRAKMLTIMTEAAVETRLLRDLDDFGVSGYTVWEARGRGSRGIRRGDWTENRNIAVQVICDPHTAQALARHVADRYFDDFAMVLYTSDVEVVRRGRFDASGAGDGDDTAAATGE